jgi:hypothetical protein
MWSSSTAPRTVGTAAVQGIPPMHREIAMDYVHILRLSGGTAVEHWGVRDDVALMRELGALPARPAAVGCGELANLSEPSPRYGA